MYSPISDHCSPHVKESKIVLYSGFHAVDSGFQVVDLSMELGFFRGNLDSTGKHFPDSWIRTLLSEEFQYILLHLSDKLSVLYNIDIG